MLLLSFVAIHYTFLLFRPMKEKMMMVPQYEDIKTVCLITTRYEYIVQWVHSPLRHCKHHPGTLNRRRELHDNSIQWMASSSPHPQPHWMASMLCFLCFGSERRQWRWVTLFSNYGFRRRRARQSESVPAK